VWALGVVLYELLALCHPFEARNQAALVLTLTLTPTLTRRSSSPSPSPSPQAALVLKIVRGQYEPPSGAYSAGLVSLTLT